MRIGQADQRISLQHVTVADPDDNGSAVPTIGAAYATVWAKRIDAGGREYFQAEQKQAQLDTRFLIRYRADVVVTDRISYDGMSYDITHIERIGRKKELMLFASAVRA